MMDCPSPRPWTTTRYYSIASRRRLPSPRPSPQLDRDFPEHKTQTKTVLKSLASLTESMSSLEAGQHVFHILLAEGVAFVGLCDRLYPKKLAFSLLTDLQRDFLREYGGLVDSASRPYAFIKFDNVIQKTKRSYQDVRARQNLDRLQEELLDVTKIMTTSISDVLERGGKLESMSLLSSNLSQESKRYLRDTKRLNLMMLWRTYGPLVIILGGLFLFFYVYFRFL